MALEAIKEIRESELKAREIEKNAITKAKDVVKKSTEEAQTRYDYVSIKAKEEANRLINEAIDSGSKEKIRILEKGKLECEDIRKVSQDKKNRAVKLVIERIVKIHGNS